MIYLDSSVALAHLLAEDRFPPDTLWHQPLVSSRLLECEVWNRINARRLQDSHGDDVRALAEHVDRLERRIAQLEANAFEDQVRRTLRVCLQGLGVQRRRPGRRARTRRRCSH